MKIPTLEGIIRRRLLVNFRVDPGTMQKLLPDRFRPKLHHGHAIAGLCLIRLEQVRPAGMPALLAFSSENAAHRVAVEWTTRQGKTREGVYIFRRDTDSTLAQLAGGRLFPGAHHPAKFHITDHLGEIDFTMTSRTGDADIRLHGVESDALPPSSSFASLAESSRFFENGSLGYSPSRRGARRPVARTTCCPGSRGVIPREQEATEDARTSQDTKFDGLRLETEHWTVRPLTITRVESRWLAENSPGAQFDHALLMRDIPHSWHAEENLTTSLPAPSPASSGRPPKDVPSVPSVPSVSSAPLNP
jgi:Uncharacterized conserved protein (COG2071)